MKVIIAGAGIGGLSSAIAMQREGHEVEVYDRVREMRPIGAAISVWSNGVKCLKSFGLNPHKYSGQMDRMAYRRHDSGELYCEFPLDSLYERVKERACPIARTDLQKMLYDGVKPGSVTLNKKAVDYTATEEGVTLAFEDGSSASGDFLIIADGTHSKLRNKICDKVIERQYVGYVNFNGALPQSALKGTIPGTTWTQFVGDGKRVSMMPMSEDRFYFFFDVSLPRGSMTSEDGVRAELKEYFKGWHEAVQLIIDNFELSKLARVEICDTDTLSTLIDKSGRAVLIGDAAHATAPDLGQGGCLAMEDSFVLAHLAKQEGLSGSDGKPAPAPTAEQLKSIAKAYQESRGKRVGDTVLRARKRAAITHALDGFEQTNEWYRELTGEDGTHIMDGMSKTILGAPKELDVYAHVQPVVSDDSRPMLVELADGS